VIRESLQDEGVAVLAGERIKEHNATVHFGVDFNPRDGHKFESFIIDTHKFIGQNLTKGFPKASRARVRMCRRVTRWSARFT